MKSKLQNEYLTNSDKYVKNKLLEFIIQLVKGYYSVPNGYNEIKTRKREIVYARQMAMYLIRKNLGSFIPLSEIGKKFGDKNHATILHGIRQIENLKSWDTKVKKEEQELQKVIRFKESVITENINLKKDFYYIDLDNFESAKLFGNKSIIFQGFDEKEKVEFLAQFKNLIQERRSHLNTGLYVLENKKQDAEEG